MFSASDTSAATVLLLLSALSSLALGGIVLIRNPRRRTHQVFALLTLNLALWTLGVLMIIHAHVESSARFWIMLTFAVASFLPATFYQFIVFFPYQRMQGKRWVLNLLYGGALALVAVLPMTANTQWYIHAITVSADAPPQVVYGPIFYVFSFLVAVCMVFTFMNLVVKVRNTEGIQRRQVQHVLVSIFASTGFASLTNLLAPALKISAMERYGPCFMVLLMGGLAYSMVRYHLLDIWGIVSRATVYAVVTGFVIATFLSTISLMHWLFIGGGTARDIVTTALAALIIVLVIQPLKERTQLFLERSMLHRRYDAKALISRVSQYATQMTRLEELLARVADDLRQTVGVKRIRILLIGGQGRGALTTAYSTNAEEIGSENGNLDVLVDYIERNPAPIVLEKLIHGRPSEESFKIAEHLAELEAYLLVPLRTTASVVGMIALGQKATRDIYTQEDVKVFETVAAPLATAIENARLYCELAELNQNLERIMANMRGAVVAVDGDGRITTANQEARELMPGIGPGKTLDMLDEAVGDLLRQTLKSGRGISDVETTIAAANGEDLPVAMSSSFFSTGEQGKAGAMVLIYNMSRIKRLESNVQRADRLTSIGTLAAGMAHEIKNPLQSIKTFTQLLLKRYDDQDFRDTFAEVVPPEVQRIDTIVSRLLHFARPRPVQFATRNLQAIIEDVLALLDNQLRSAKIKVETDYPPRPLELIADEQQLHQVFLNLFLNAIDAMKEAGQGRLGIKVSFDRTHLARKGQPPLLDVKCIKVEITDTGVGIPKKDIEQLFTPFFTTKAEGSGLGLSVVHGIITEHQGVIDVASAPGNGAAFTVTFPLVARAESLERVGA